MARVCSLFFATFLLASAALSQHVKESVIVVQACRGKMVIAADPQRPRSGGCNLIALNDDVVFAATGFVKGSNPEDPQQVFDAESSARVALAKVLRFQHRFPESDRSFHIAHGLAGEWRREFARSFIHAAKSYLLKQNPTGVETRVVFATTDGSRYGTFEARITCTPANISAGCEGENTALVPDPNDCNYTFYGVDDIVTKALNPASNEYRRYKEALGRDQEGTESAFPVRLVELTQDFSTDSKNVSNGKVVSVELRGAQKPLWNQAPSCK